MRAGYAESGAHKQGYRLTRNATVKAAIDAGKEEISRRAMINQDEVIKELARIGFADMAKYVKIDHSGAIQAIALEELEEGASRVIKKVKEKRNIRYSDSGDQIMESTYEFELHDKVKALLGILDRVKPTDPPPTQKIEHSVTFTSMPPQPKTMKEWEDLCHPERKKNPM
jgi:phage terminase small subunit